MSEQANTHQTLRAAFRASVPIMAGYVILGMAFGILLANKGYSFLWALLMSTTIYAGSMQFVAVDLLSSGASLVSAAIMTLLVNARHIIYGISMLSRYANKGKEKAVFNFFLTDETYALLCEPVPQGLDSRKYDFYISALDQLYWVTGSVLGSLLGSALPFDTAGIDFAMTALFVVIFTEQFLDHRNRIPGFIGIVVTTVCLLIFGTSSFLIPSMILIVLLLSVRGYRGIPGKGRWQND
jgi:4-azaleucine resistance transporter AzlC